MEKKDKNKKTLFWDWRQKLGFFLICLTLFLIIISLIFLATANFRNQNNNFLGDGFWCLKHYGISNIFNNYNNLDANAAKNAFLSHPFPEVYYAFFFLIILGPIFLFLGIFLFIRGWWKTRI